MRFNPDALDRHITGNWGEDQFPPEAAAACDDPAVGHDLRFLGVQYEDGQGFPTFQCRHCGDFFDWDDACGCAHCEKGKAGQL